MKKIFLFALCITSLWSCRKDNSGFDGPSIKEMFGPFKMEEDFKASRDSVDFGNGETVLFTARFNKAIAWRITVTGQTSHAKKIITGLSKTIDTPAGIWNGSTTIFPMFRIENCVAVLSLDGVADSFQVATKIKSIKVNTGLVIADFENGFDPAWTKFVQTGADMDFNIKNDGYAPQGVKYLNMAGTVNWDWLIGMIDYPASAYGGGKTLPLPSNPDQVYFNCLIYGVPNTNESLVLFQFKEDEHATGNIDPNTNDEYDLQIHVNWTGWKLISVRYSDLPYLNNGQPAVPKGNNQHNPDKIGKISMLELADPSNGFASCKIDYLIFTSSPLEP
ncbi:MAG: hypothetical protein NTU51_01200 [Bacteroidetes bacterium]|nr:hypothetical protein [Bacteroidota bacterium]